MTSTQPPPPVTDPRRILYWIYAGRLTVALSIWGAAFVVGQDPFVVGRLGVAAGRTLSLVMLLTVGFVTAASYWASHLRGVGRGPRFLYVQAAIDILLVTGVVLLTGGSDSVFPPLLYVALVSGYAVMVTASAGLIIGGITGAAYLFAIALAYPEQLGLGVLLQTVIFTTVALFAGWVGGRLRQVGRQLTTLESELGRLRFGTDDILRTIEAAVITIDSDGRAVYLNPACARLFGVEPEEWIGRSVAETLVEAGPEVVDALEQTLSTGEPLRGREVDVRTVEDGPIPHSVSTALLERDGAPTLTTIVMQDLRLSRQLEELHLRASRLGVVAELSASLAHEIKNPLASIRSAVEQIADPESDPKDRESLSNLVVRETDRLSRLLGEFNDFARVDVAERKPIELDRVIREAVAVVAQQPEAHDRATFDIQLDSGVDDLWGDPDLVHRTLTNLLLNAVQVSDPEGTVTVRVIVDALSSAATPSGLAGGTPVRIRVVDDGPGIDPADAARVFDPFYTRRQGGSGMGLAIAHRAVQAHGGALLVSSTPGEGATFAIILPRRNASARKGFEEAGGEELVSRFDPTRAAERDARQPAPLDGFADRLG